MHAVDVVLPVLNEAEALPWVLRRMPVWCRAIVVDNGLGHTIGMPAGGYSNTWEWDETLVFPKSGKPVLGFMYNIGHTVRPNGSILEGEAAAVAEPLPQTRDNYKDYYPQLLARAFAHLGLK